MSSAIRTKNKKNQKMCYKLISYGFPLELNTTGYFNSLTTILFIHLIYFFFIVFTSWLKIRSLVTETM